MFKDFWKVDPSHGESRFAQLLGAWLLIFMIVFSIWHMEKANLNGANFKNDSLSFSEISDAKLENANLYRFFKNSLRYTEGWYKWL